MFGANGATTPVTTPVTTVKVFVLRFEVNGVQTWWKESLDSQTAFRLAKRMAIEGYKPTLRRVKVFPVIKEDRTCQLLN